MSPPDPAKKLAALVKKLRAGRDEPPRDPAMAGRDDPACPMLWQLVFSFLAWEASCARASTAAKRLHGAVVDYNEMRVALVDELAGILGDRYPRAVERSARLRSTLNDLYKREHAVTLERIADMPKRDARLFLESLEGMPPYVAARLLLLSLGGHAFPLDERTHAALTEEGAAPPDLSLQDAAGWLERQFRAGEAAEPYLLIEEWMNDRPVSKSPKGAPRGGRTGVATADRTRTARVKKPVKD